MHNARFRINVSRLFINFHLYKYVYQTAFGDIFALLSSCFLVLIAAMLKLDVLNFAAPRKSYQGY